MQGVLYKSIIILVAALVLAGCTSTADRDGSRARVEERGIGAADAGDDEAVTQGLDDDRGFTGDALEDPASPLSVRIIYFEYDSSTVRAEFRETIAAHAMYLATNAGASVTLEGHADERGSREYNLALGERRALAVRRQIVLLGASAGQIRTVSYGEERPIVEDHDDESYAQNRRVEIIY